MKPVYANTFGIRKVCDRDGDLVEATLDIAHKYMESNITVTPKGVETIATPAADQIASIVLTKQSAISLRNLLIQTLGEYS